jgi:WD40 repeat protein
MLNRCLCFVISVIQVWDLGENSCAHTIVPPVERGSTMRCLALTSRHLFCGSSRGGIYVYSLHAVCEREDTHHCKDPATGPRPFCLQASLSHGSTIIRCLLAAGPSYAQTFLFSGSMDGTIRAWRIPEVGVLFEPYALWKAHTDSINAMTATWNHLYTASADGYVKVWHLSKNPQYVRRLECQQQAVKSLCVTESSTGGFMWVGLTSGLVLQFRIGTYG